MLNFTLTPTQRDLVRGVTNAGGKIWIVGGAIRDQLLGITPKDIDFATDLIPNDIKIICKTKTNLRIIPDARGQQHGTIKIVDRDTGVDIDITTLRQDISTNGRHAIVKFSKDINVDLSRRDLTINAQAIEIDKYFTSLESRDPFDGSSDCRDKLVKFCGSTLSRCREDALRAIRACRFTALGRGWRLDDKTKRELKIFATNPLLNKISKERIRNEILKALSYSMPSNFFRSLHSCNLLEFVIPELINGIDCEENEYHGKDKFKCKKCGTIILGPEYKKLKRNNISHC